MNNVDDEIQNEFDILFKYLLKIIETNIISSSIKKFHIAFFTII